MEHTKNLICILLVTVLVICCDKSNSTGKSIKPKPTLTGELTITGCNFSKHDPNSVIITDCIEFQYLHNDRLEMVHYNAALSCEIENQHQNLSLNIEVYDNIISIEAIEGTQAITDCVCLYKIHFSLKDIQPKKYIIKIIEQHRKNTDDQLILRNNFSEVQKGSISVNRNHYPWVQ